ncbi:DUF1254 domain-containing protein [Denitratisoma oestradiolicum]|uniref:DUF1254 domain-containing protein n=1 Tax=Denitratisoma oestradiolicum TaxID=311182 RepID=A0A6S6XX42_9PROT|nr:DUF1254 domain-containing protein [Denitratisoma oestradiolicum]CAB1369524.1 conserved exported protein of unknown function [Denitratisoma oestradiolicum]
MAFLRVLIVGLLCCSMLRSWAIEEGTTLQGATMAWNEEFAYLTGMQAFIYGYPIITFAELRAQPLPGGQSMVNRYFHTRHLADPGQKYGGSPNRETAYSLAFADVSREPVVLTVPPNPRQRYYSLQLCDMYSDTIGYIGLRATHNIPGDYLLAGPGWKGKAPKGMQKVIRSWTPWVAVFGRTYTDGTEDDLPRMSAFQDGYRITPLRGYRRNTSLAKSHAASQVTSKADPLSAFKTMNAAMKENPPPPGHAALMQQFALVGLGPAAKQDIEQLDPAIQRGLRRAIVDGRALLARVAKAGGSIVGATQVRNGWFYGPSNWGRMAASGDFLGRAGTQVFSGIVEHQIEESVKLRTFVDAESKPLSGDHRYVVHFRKEEIPVAHAFWSVTLYDENFNLVPNEAGRYGFGDKVPGLKYGTDGSLTIYIQPDRPEGEKAANWLPSPRDKDFNLFLRAYFPGPGLLDQSYAAPSVHRVVE